MLTFPDAIAAVTAAHDSDVQTAQDTAYKNGALSRQPEVDAATSRVTDLQAQLAAALAKDTTDLATIAGLQAKLLALQPPVDIRPLITAAKGGAITLPAGILEGADFNSPPNSPFYAIFAYQVPSFTGAGIGKTVLRLKPGSNTRTAPAQNSGAAVVNPYYLLRVDGQKTPDVGAFTLLGSNDVLHNGLILYTQSTGLPSVKRLHDVLIKGIPGNAGVNPGETFSLNLFHQTGTLVEDVEIDGTDSTGKIVAASGIGVNFASKLLFRRVRSAHTGFGAGWANYESADLAYEDCVSEDTAYYSQNFENCRGSIRLTRHTFRASAVRTQSPSEAGFHMAVATNGGATAKYLIEDPNFTGPKFLVRSTGYLGKPKTQTDSDIVLTVGGVPRPDLLAITTK